MSYCSDCVRAIELYLPEEGEWTGEHIRILGISEGWIVPPEEPNQWGPVIRACKRLGILVPTGSMKATTTAISKSHLTSIYKKGTRHGNTGTY